MINVPTHKHHNNPLNTQRPFMSLHLDEYLIVTVQVHSIKKLFKGVKMTTAKWTINTREQQDLRYPAARLNEKGWFAGVGWRCSKDSPSSRRDSYKCNRLVSLSA